MENLSDVLNYTHKKFQFKRRLEMDDKDEVHCLEEPPEKMFKIEPIDEEIEPEQKSSTGSDGNSKNKKFTKILNELNGEQVQNVMKYHANMVRVFPKKERTPEEQKRRDANTMACRVSRRYKRLEAIAVQKNRIKTEEAITEAHKDLVNETTYFQLLTMLQNLTKEVFTLDIENLGEEREISLLKSEMTPANITTEQTSKIKFSIDYILNEA